MVISKDNEQSLNNYFKSSVSAECFRELRTGFCTKNLQRQVFGDIPRSTLDDRRQSTYLRSPKSGIALAHKHSVLYMIFNKP